MPSSRFVRLTGQLLALLFSCFEWRRNFGFFARIREIWNREIAHNTSLWTNLQQSFGKTITKNLSFSYYMFENISLRAVSRCIIERRKHRLTKIRILQCPTRVWTPLAGDETLFTTRRDIVFVSWRSRQFLGLKTRSYTKLRFSRRSSPDRRKAHCESCDRDDCFANETQELHLNASMLVYGSKTILSCFVHSTFSSETFVQLCSIRIQRIGRPLVRK